MALTDNLQVYYKLDESSGNASAAVGSPATLTNVNTVTYGTGIINNGAQMDGTTKYLKSSSNVTITNTDMSVNLWQKFTVGSNNAVSQYGTVDAERNWIFTPYGYGGLNFLSFGAGPWGVAWTPSTGVWYMCTMTYVTATGALKMYVNGSQIGTTQTASTGLPGNKNAPVYLGTWDGETNGGMLNGTIDEVGIWTRALSDAEITTLYNSGAGLQYPFSTSAIKTLDGLAYASAKTVDGLAIASMKTWNGLA